MNHPPLPAIKVKQIRTKHPNEYKILNAMLILLARKLSDRCDLGIEGTVEATEILLDTGWAKLVFFDDSFDIAAWDPETGQYRIGDKVY